MKRLLAVFLVLVLVGSISQAASRTWKSSNGRFSVEAELLDFKDGKAQLKKSDGTVIEVPLVSLVRGGPAVRQEPVSRRRRREARSRRRVPRVEEQERQVQHDCRVPRLCGRQGPIAQARRQRDFRR